ncbi:hypothetical protein KAS08_04555 [Candidatus Pacearchaeota archaeon]|nr:hypothetical protein [Candidatus Pacearchaeota archaeon]
MRGEKGKFVVIDGLDGVGKGVVERAILDFEKSRGKKVFDTIRWGKENPGLRLDFDSIRDGNYDIIHTGEPTYSNLGLDIRKEMISASNGRHYSSESLVQAYALDREIQMKSLVVPCVESGVDDMQSRSLIVSLCYQGLNAIDEGKSLKDTVRHILDQPGNRYQLEHFSDLVIIPTISGIEELIARLEKRNKKDDAIFENIEFQSRAKPLFESDWIRDIIESHGGKVAYLDAGISIESSKDQAVKIYDSFKTTGEIPREFRSPIF